MSNQPITDMIETIERYAQLQPDYPVYNVLGEEHTYGQLKATKVANISYSCPPKTTTGDFSGSPIWSRWAAKLSESAFNWP